MTTDKIERTECINKICDLVQPNSILAEVGVLSGECTILFNNSNKFEKIYCIDPWENGYDINDPTSNINMHQIECNFDENIKNFSNIEKIKLTSISACKLLQDIKLDIVYIDACHTYEAVKEDILNWIKLIKPGGIISGHDFGRHADWCYFPGVEKAVLETLGPPDIVLADTSWVKIIK